MICPCCGADQSKPQCSCGFDFTTDYEAYPTLNPLLPEELAPIGGKDDLGALTRSLEKLEKRIRDQDLPCQVLESFRKLQRAAEAFSREYGYYSRIRQEGLWQIIDRSPRRVLAAGGHISLGLRSGGQVLCAGDDDIRLACSYWSDIIAVAACHYHCIALKQDGTVVTNDPGSAPELKEWSHIRAVAAGNSYFSKDALFAGLTDRGTVVTNAASRQMANRISGWEHVKEIAVGGAMVFAVFENGMVEAAGQNNCGADQVENWTGVCSAASSGRHTLGLRTDGTVLAAGLNPNGECEVGGWSRIIAVACGDRHSVGLRADGTVAACGDNRFHQCEVEGWTDIVAIAAGADHTLGLRSDGTVVSTGSNRYGQCRVDGWYHIFPSEKK